jgi:hypothetical protein
VLTVFPLVGLGVYLLIRLNIESRVIRFLLIVPMAFGGSLLIGFLLACFGTFKPSSPQIEINLKHD